MESLSDKLIRERETRPAVRMYVVCNVFDNGSHSVGTRPMDRDETIAPVAARTGRTRWSLAVAISDLQAGYVDIDKNPCNFEGSTNVRVSIVEG